MLTVGVRAHDYGCGEPQEKFASIAQDGWKTIQLACKKSIAGVHSSADVTRALTDKIAASLRQNRLTVGVLGAYEELASGDDAMRKQAVKEFIAYLPVAKSLAAHCVGTETTNRAAQPFTPQNEATRHLAHSLGEILPVAENLGVMVAIEPVYYHTMATPEQTREILRMMQSRNLKVIFDPVNLLSPAEEADQYALWQRSFEAFAPDIAAVHMKGVRFINGEAISVNFADSTVDYAYIFKELRRLPQDLPILREEAVVANGKNDFAFLQNLCEGK